MRTAVAVLCLVGVLFVSQNAEAGTTFELMRQTAGLLILSCHQINAVCSSPSLRSPLYPPFRLCHPVAQPTKQATQVCT